MLFDIFADEEVILRHLTADDILTIVVGATDHVTFQDIMLWKIEVVNLNGKCCAFVGGKIIISRQKGKAVSTDIVERALYGGTILL